MCSNATSCTKQYDFGQYIQLLALFLLYCVSRCLAFNKVDEDLTLPPALYSCVFDRRETAEEKGEVERRINMRRICFLKNWLHRLSYVRVWNEWIILSLVSFWVLSSALSLFHLSIFFPYFLQLLFGFSGKKCLNKHCRDGGSGHWHTPSVFLQPQMSSTNRKLISSW